MDGRQCAGCERALFRRKAVGRWPKWCEDCRPHADKSYRHFIAEPRPCDECGATFTPYRSDNRFCSSGCQSKSQERRRTIEGATQARRAARLAAGKFVRTCACGTVFPIHSPSACKKRCDGCAARSAAPSPALKIYVIDCAWCGKAATVRRPNQRFCGKQCRDADYSRRMAPRIMGLYRTAFETGRVKQAMFWRRTLVEVLQERDGECCGICGDPMDFKARTGPRGVNDFGVTVDHIYPWSLGGSDKLENLRLAHWACNNRRGNRLEESA